MGDRIYNDDKGQYYYDENGNKIYIKPKNRNGIHPSVQAAIITAIAGIVIAIFGTMPVGSSEQPIACQVFDSPLINSIYNCGGTIEIAVNATLTAIAPTPNTIETIIAETLTAIASLSIVEPSTTPASISTALATQTPTNLPPPSIIPQPTTLQISCDNPQIISASQSDRYTYTQYYTDLYKQCDWVNLWTALVNAGSVSGSPPIQRSQECWGEEQTQNDQFSCITWYGIEAYILDATQEVTIHDPHCIIYDPSSSPTNVTQLPDYKQENRGSDRLITNARVTGHFTFYMWCVARWE